MSESSGAVSAGALASDPIRPGWAAVGLVALFAILAARIGSVYGEVTGTIDEGRHVAASIEIYQSGDYSVYYHSPPLPRYFTGLLPYLDGARIPEDEQADDYTPYLDAVEGHRESAIGKYALEASGSYWRTLTLSRVGTLVFLAALLLYVYRWSSMLFGRLAGLVAAATISWSPNIIAHGTLATADIPFTATYLAACYHLWRWSQQPGRAPCIAAAIACAAAMMSKFPAPLFLAPVAIAYFAIARWKTWTNRRAWSAAAAKTAVLRGLLFAAVVFVAVWATYLFSMGTATERMEWLAKAIDFRFAPGSTLHGVLHWFAGNVPIPMPEFFDGLYDLANEASRRWTGYLLGESSQEGHLLYFPIAIGVKTSPGFLLMTAVAAGLLLAERRASWTHPAVYLLVGAGFYLAIVMAKRMNIGIRHALCVYPFAAVLASALFASFALPALTADRLRRALRGVGIGLLIWHGASSALAHPDYLAYFNVIARGRESYFLLDSNLDWGQDLGRLGDWVDEQDIGHITLSVFGARFGTSPEAAGLANAYLLAPDERPHGWFAVSENHLGGIGMSAETWKRLDGFSWLDEHEPVTRIGKSILVYRLP